VAVHEVSDTNDTKITSSNTILERLPFFLQYFNGEKNQLDEWLNFTAAPGLVRGSKGIKVSRALLGFLLLLSCSSTLGGYLEGKDSLQ
jgi:hypothetical protein